MKHKFLISFLAIVLVLVFTVVYRCYFKKQALISPLTGYKTFQEQLKEELKLRSFEIKQFKHEDVGSVEVELNDGLLVYFSSQSEINKQLDSLQLILQRAKIEGRLITTIDLRFDKPVVNQSN